MKIRCQSAPLHLLVVLMLLSWSQRVESASTSDCPNQYLYTQQPPQEIFVCNPYESGQLSLSCSVIGQNVTNIQWWFAPDFVDENATQLTESSKYKLEPTVSAEGLEVQLTVNDLGDEDVGTYWCQASVEDKSGVQLLSTSESVELQEMSWFEMNLIANKCMHVLRNSDIRCASILVTPPSSVTTTTTRLPDSPTLSSSVVYPSPSPATETYTVSPQLPTTQPVSATVPSGLFQTSSIILYAVLGLVGFLAIACVLLIIVVAMLCRRKCARHNMKDCSEKGAGFISQFSSSQSGCPPAAYKHTESTHVIHTDAAHHRTMSGEYAEIGPALSVSQEYGHAHILHSSLPPIPTELDPESNQFQNPGYENPYDLLVFTAQSQTSEADDVTSKKSPEKTEGADSQNVKSHDYHMLEQIVPATLDSTTPVISPQHTYHTLEHTAPSLVESFDDPDATTSAYDDIIPHEPSQRLSCDSTSEVSRLPTIPENDMEDQRSVEYVNVVPAGSHLHPIASDAVSPDLSTTVDLKNCAGFSESPKDDGEYDRLVDPPHLYHILEHSPSLPGYPRVHSFDMTIATSNTYSHLEPGHSTKDDTHLQQLPHIHFVSQHTNASDTYSSESSLEGTESNVFDDPQYLVGLPSRAMVVKSACSMRDKLKELQKTHDQHRQQPPALGHRDKTEAHSDSILLKYSGDYERDPVYMQKLYNESQRNSSHSESSTGISQYPLQILDDSMWGNDSGFATYSSRRSSLPNLGKHIYQPLETETLEPVQPYDKLKKNKKEEPVM